MIYCVVPEPLAEELYDKLVDYYADDPNVKVIVDRRKEDRRSGANGHDDRADRGRRETRDRRSRPRAVPDLPRASSE